MHKWLWCVLRGINMPKSLLDAVKRMYNGNSAFLNTDGGLQLLFVVVSGVLQGCPLSGSLFVICIDPLLYLFKSKIEDLSLGTIRACADDIGASLRALYHLPILERAFASFKKVSGLTLKPKKCVLILTCITASPANINAIARWLQANCPNWAYFQITNVGKYLGFQMGPLGGDIQWKAPMEKFKQRVREVKAESLPLGMAAAQYASRAIPVLGYVGQLVPPPPLFTSTELWAAHKILGIPLSLDVRAIHGLSAMGGTKLVRASHYIMSCMLRGASKTIVGYSDMHNDLVAKAVEGTTLYQAFFSDLRPPGWQADAFASNLHRASLGDLRGYEAHADSIKATFESVRAGDGLAGRKGGNQQSALYSHLSSLTPPDWLATLECKLDAFDCLDEVDYTLTSDAVSKLCAALCKLGARVSMAVVKSWANAWTTSTRMHEPQLLPCIFGCPNCEDSLDHYLCCDPLWTAVISCSFKYAELLQAGPFSKLGLGGSSAWLQMLAIAFSCYHAIKMSHRDEILKFLESGHLCQVHDRLIGYAKVFSCEIVSCG